MSTISVWKKNVEQIISYPLINAVPRSMIAVVKDDYLYRDTSRTRL